MKRPIPICAAHALIQPSSANDSQVAAEGHFVGGVYAKYLTEISR